MSVSRVVSAVIIAKKLSSCQIENALLSFSGKRGQAKERRIQPSTRHGEPLPCLGRLISPAGSGIIPAQVFFGIGIMPLSGEKRFKWAAPALALFTVLASFLVYIPSLDNGFVNWDDPTYVLENAHIRSLGPEFFNFALTSFYFSNWHPLTLVSYAFDYALWKDDPFGDHLVNNIFHSFNTGLVVKGIGDEKKECHGLHIDSVGHR